MGPLTGEDEPEDVDAASPTSEQKQADPKTDPSPPKREFDAAAYKPGLDAWTGAVEAMRPQMTSLAGDSAFRLLPAVLNVLRPQLTTSFRTNSPAFKMLPAAFETLQPQIANSLMGKPGFPAFLAGLQSFRPLAGLDPSILSAMSASSTLPDFERLAPLLAKGVPASLLTGSFAKQLGGQVALDPALAAALKSPMRNVAREVAQQVTSHFLDPAARSIRVPRIIDMPEQSMLVNEAMSGDLSGLSLPDIARDVARGVTEPLPLGDDALLSSDRSRVEGWVHPVAIKVSAFAASKNWGEEIFVVYVWVMTYCVCLALLLNYPFPETIDGLLGKAGLSVTPLLPAKVSSKIARPVYRRVTGADM